MEKKNSFSRDSALIVFLFWGTVAAVALLSAIRPGAPLRPPLTPTTRGLFNCRPALWAALCVLACSVIAAPAGAAQVPVPSYSARVLDIAGKLDGSQISALNEQILELEVSTRAAVVVFMLPSTGEEEIEEYATRVFQEWKLGDAGRDDGILILVAIQDKRMRIEVGQGLEGSVPDVLAGRIIDQQMKPRFRNNDYAGGLEAAINEIGALMRGDLNTVDAEDPETSPLVRAYLYLIAGVAGCLLVGTIAVCVHRVLKRSLLDFGVRSALVAGIVTWVAFENPPGQLWTDWGSWLPVGATIGLAMLFVFLPGSTSGGSGSGGRNSSGSSSSSSSSSRSSSGGSSSGGGASGRW